MTNFRHSRSREKHSGFTLTEAVISVVMIAIIAMSMAGVFAYGRRAIETANQKMIAIHRLEKQVAFFRATGAMTLEPTAAPVVTTVPELRNGILEWTISEPEAGNSAWKEVRISIGWDSVNVPELVPPNAHAAVAQCEFSRTVTSFLSQG